MSTMTRVLSPADKTQKAGGTVGGADDGAPAPGKRRKVMILVLAVLLLAGGGGYWFLLGPGAADASGEEAVAEPPPEPGEVVLVEPISLNLAGGHYLRLGLGLQLVADVHEAVDTARALDIAIELYSGRDVAEVGSGEGRDALKAELVTRLVEAYHGDVMGVYLTDYVTQ